MNISKLTLILTILVTISIGTVLLINNSAKVIAQGNEITVTIIKDAPNKANKAFNPNILNIKAGQKVKWINMDSQIHTVTSGTDANDLQSGKVFDSTALSANAHYEFTFQTPGVFSYYCQFHPQMVGKVIVS
jgi:plastocyanin